MPGYKEFSSGERLFASDVNDYLSKQTVMRFADASARDTALSGALREGMVAYLDDTDEVLKYDGSAWDTVGGGLVAVKHALFTGTQTNSTAAGANFAVTDLSITHTLADASNKLIISAYFGVVGTSQGFATAGIAVADDGTLIAVGDSAGVRTRVGAGGHTSDGSANYVISMPSVSFVYEPGDTASHTYTVRAVNIRVQTETVYINRSEVDTANEGAPRASSGFVIQEVKV